MPLDGELFDRADRLLEAALELEDGERAAFLDRECGADAELRRLLDRLLAEARTDPSFLRPGAAVRSTLLERFLNGESPEDAATLEGAIVGRWRIVDEIGRGGMAVVYRAERADGAFEQTVALKVVKRGTDTDEVVRRFGQERQILALARHPDLARLLDGGVTPDGRPYFVMEYVEGEPIDRYCDGRGLGVAERLRLFLRVARAVDYAHRNLVVHRDIKPSNILVTREGHPKLLDFGIAKLVEGDGAEQTVTGTRMRFMTPAYASPEQLAGAAVTTVSDVYQLGVLLYVLLTGALPYRVDGTAPGEIARAILERDPTRPSASRAIPERRRRALRGDLDNILLKALRKEPERRYGTVAQLVDDVERHLDGRPVAARSDTLSYRLSKLVARHKLAFGTAVTALAVLGGLVAVHVVRVSRERDRALEALRQVEQARDELNELATFLTGLFEVSDPSRARGRTITARELLEAGAARVRRELDDRPLTQARLMLAIGKVYRSLGLYDDAEPLLTDALRSRRANLPPGSPEIAESLAALGTLRMLTSRLDEAETLHRQALAIRETRLGADAPAVGESLNDVASVLFARGELDDAEPLFRRALAVYQRSEGPESARAVEVLSNLAVTLLQAGRLDESEPLLRRAIAIQRRTLPRDHPDLAMNLQNLATLLTRHERLAESEELYDEALAILTRAFGEEHDQVVQVLSNIAYLYELEGRVDDAERLHLRTVEMRERTLGPDHIAVSHALGKLALLYWRHDRIEDALAAQHRMNAIRSAVLGSDHPRLVATVALEGEMNRRLRRLAEAERLFRRSAAIAENARGPDDVEIALGLHGLGRVALDRGTPASAIAPLERAIELRRAALAPDDPLLREIEADLERARSALDDRPS